MKPLDGYDKLRGGYYTPSAIADFVASWAIQENSAIVLEPSCGDGSFLEATQKRLMELGLSEKRITRQVTGVELDANEAKKASIYKASIINKDFFTFFHDEIYGKIRYDAIVGNPPFIRYQNFNAEYRDLAFSLMREFGFHPNKLTNIWLPFLILSCMALKDNGRIGMVIPAELFQVDYAAEARMFLSEYFDGLTLITFKQLVFDGIQQEVVILLGERRSQMPGIRVVELNDLEELITRGQTCLESSTIKTLDHSTDKWVKYYLTNDEIALLRRLNSDERIKSATELFEINVGLVSGENDFFIMNESQVGNFNVGKSVEKIISKSYQLKGINLTDQDFNSLVVSGKKVFFFAPADKPLNKLSLPEKSYITFGESNSYHTNYKCKIRKRWYIVPKSWKPEAILLRQVNTYPKMVINSTGALVTDTLHKVKFNPGVNGAMVSSAFLNSYTFALSETTGRSYGGGVLTFEPGEIRKLRIPMQLAETLDTNKIDSLLRSGCIEQILNYTDYVLLKNGLALTDDEIAMLRGIWIKMRDRRLNRKKSRR